MSFGYGHAPRWDHVDILHGRAIADPYRWLEDPDSDETRRWARAQDALFAEHADRWGGRGWFRRRITEFLRFRCEVPPVQRGHRRFFHRQRLGQEHPVLVVAEGDDERVLVDPMALDPAGLTTLHDWEPSHEGDLVAVQTSGGGSDESILVVLDVSSGDVVDGPIDRLRCSPVAWLPGGKAFYYVRFLAPRTGPAGQPDDLRRAVFLHRLGTDAAHDSMVFPPDPDEPTRPEVDITSDGRWLSVCVNYGTGTRNDLWLADLEGSDPAGPRFTALQHGEDGETSLDVGDDGRLYLLTDRDAPRGRLCVTTPDRPAPPAWRELIPERSDANLDDFVILEDPKTGDPQLLACWTRHSFSEITVHDGLTGEQVGVVEPPGEGTVEEIGTTPDVPDQAWFVYSDPVTPPSTWWYDAGSRATRPLVQDGALVRIPQIHTVVVDYRSSDGTPVRMSILAPLPAPDCPRPTILYAYGGFGDTWERGYDASILAWVEAGGVYAIAHVRGGGEGGAAWHHAATLANKQKTFDDVAAAAGWLADHGWTTPERLCLLGDSNGGLTMGAVLTQHPELCNAAVIHSAPLDMVRYEHFGNGRLWRREYGTASDPRHLDWLLSYSPYHHVVRGVSYPATLLTVYDNDATVDPFHSRKMSASLQWATVGDRPILLRRRADGGHGETARSRTIEAGADALAFAAHWTGLALPLDEHRDAAHRTDPDQQEEGGGGAHDGQDAAPLEHRRARIREQH
jgi:prolyl oligopeptidase